MNKAIRLLAVAGLKEMMTSALNRTGPRKKVSVVNDHQQQLLVIHQYEGKRGSMTLNLKKGLATNVRVIKLLNRNYVMVQESGLFRSRIRILKTADILSILVIV